jgi:hypothetical protein
MYYKTLKKTVQAIQNKRCGMLISGVSFFYNNACLHTAICTQALLQHFNWQFFDHLPQYIN